MEQNESPRKNRARPIALDSDYKFSIRARIVFINFTVLFIIGFCILFFYLWGQPYERGFFCDDESLKHPYKDSTVTNVTLYIVGIGLPVISMILIEFLRLKDYKGQSLTLFGKEVSPWVCEVYKIVGMYLFGMACQQLTTDIAKYTIGRLRPHFFAVCKPDIDCDLPENKWKYITYFKCLNDDPKLLKEMRLSFPSGHSSFSAYTMIYFAMYLEKRFPRQGVKLVRHGIQFILIMFSWYTVMTRVSDYKHHWSDVLAGFSIGMLYAIVVFTFLSGVRRLPKIRLTNQDAELHITNGNTRPGTGWQV